MKQSYLYKGSLYTVELAGSRARIGERQLAFALRGRGSGEWLIKLDGQPQRVRWAKAGRKLWLHVDGRTYELEKAAGSRAAGASGASERSLRAPMPGQVRAVYVKAGEQVEEGTVLLLLEAMKMELRVQAPRAARVAAVKVEAGESVDKEQVLVELDGEDA
jgi:acetyl/propionyl-CoA carboxylase alpha subunit